jgi:hypothetical protein
MNRIFLAVISVSILFSTAIEASANPVALPVNTLDNKSPILISLTISGSNFAVGDEIGVTLKYKDDKNSMYQSTNGFYGDLIWTSDSPIGTEQQLEGSHNFVKSWSLVSQTIGTDSVEETWYATVKAPNTFGQWRIGMVIIDDLVKNYSIYRFESSKFQYAPPYSEVGFAFTPTTPLINATYAVSQQLTTEKAAAEKLAADKLAAEKAAAEKLAADKLAAEKAAAEKLAADKAAADRAAALNKEMNETFIALTNNLNKYKTDIAQIFRDYPAYFNQSPELRSSLQRALDYTIPTVASQSGIDAIRELIGGGSGSALASDFLLAQAGITKYVALEKINAKTAKKTTVTCAKGKVTKKVTAVKPKCPSGYKKK